MAATANSGCFILICLYTLPLWALRKEQWGHANGFSPVWVRRCRPKSTSLRKERPHWGHAWPPSLATPLPCSVPVSWRVWVGWGASRRRWERVALDDAPACRKNKSGFSIDFGSPLASTHTVCTPWMWRLLMQSSVLILADQLVMVMMVTEGENWSLHLFPRPSYTLSMSKVVRKRVIFHASVRHCCRCSPLKRQVVPGWGRRSACRACMCLVTFPFSAARYGQNEQVNGLSPVWVSWWVFKL